MIARVSSYLVSVEDVRPLVDEVVALARARSPSRRAHAEFFFVDSSGGEGLSLVFADDVNVTPVIELPGPPSDVRHYAVHLLQLGGPRGGGVVETLLGRVVRCDPDAAGDLSFNGHSVPASPSVWARALLLAPDGDVLALAVATEHGPLVEALRNFAACAARDYDDVAYHFLGRA